MAETELDKVAGWSAEQVALLAKSWIDSAEQVVAIGATSGGIGSLAQQLKVSEAEAKRLVALAHAALPPAARAAMTQRFDDADDRGMGAMHPEREGGKKQANEEE